MRTLSFFQTTSLRLCVIFQNSLYVYWMNELIISRVIVSSICNISCLFSNIEFSLWQNVIYFDIDTFSKILNKNPENGGYGWKDANNTLMAYVCDDCPSQPTGSIITVGPCALNWLNVLCLWKDSRWRWNCWENWSLPLEQAALVTAEFVISFVCFSGLMCIFWLDI